MLLVLPRSAQSDPGSYFYLGTRKANLVLEHIYPSNDYWLLLLEV